MIKAVGRTGLGVPLLLLGLSRENVARLVAGEPVRVSAAEMGRLGMPQIEVAICYGKTEQAIIDELKALGVGPEKIRDERQAGDH